MTNINISPESVERLACLLQDWGQHDEGAINDARDDAANALRALSSALTESQDLVDRWINTSLDQHQTIFEMQEALTQSQAEVAAAYERAAEVYIDGDWDWYSDADDAIRTIATPDQTAALDKLIAEAEAQVIEQIAAMVRTWRNTTPMTGEECANAILAASKKGGV